MKNHSYYVYIVASVSGTLYTGVTNNLERRIYEHKNGCYSGFSKKYKCNKLMYYEYFEDISEAIAREKQIKKYRRDKKVVLIEKNNSHWKDLSLEWRY